MSYIVRSLLMLVVAQLSYSADANRFDQNSTGLRGKSGAVVSVLPLCVPTPSSATDRYGDPFVVVHISPSVIDINGQTIAPTELGHRLDEIFQTRTWKTLFVYPTDVTYGRVLQVVAMLTKSKFDKVILLTRKSEAEFRDYTRREDCIYYGL